MAIEICPTCEGRGHHPRSELVDYHKRDYDRWNTTCQTCKGKGRVQKITIYQPLPDVEIDDTR